MGFFDVFSKNKSGDNEITFAESLSYPMTLIFSHFKAFLILAGVVSLFVSLVTFASGRSFFCGLQIGSFCSNSGYAAILSLIVNLYGMAFFVNRWQKIACENMGIRKAISDKCLAKDMKAVGVILFYFFLWGVVFGCAFLLKQRSVTDDVSVELGFFMIVSGIIIVCLLLLLNFVGFYRYLQGGKFFTFHRTVGKSLDKFYTFISVFFIYMIIFVFFIFRGEGLFREYISYGILVEYLGEFYLYFIFCTILAVFVGSFEYQQKKLFADK